MKGTPTDLVSYLGRRNLAELQALGTFWLDLPRGGAGSEESELLTRLEQAMTSREDLLGRVSYLLHEDRQVLRQVIASSGFQATRDDLLHRPVGAVPADVVLFDRSLERLRERGFVEIARDGGWGDSHQMVVRAPRELARELVEVMGGEVRAFDRVATCSTYLANLSHNQLSDRLSRVSRAGGRDEQKKRAIARLSSIDELERRLGMLSPELSELTRITMESYSGLAFRDELAAERPDLVAAWKVQDWRDQLEAVLLGTVGLLALADHGIDRTGEAIVVFGEAVSAWKKRNPGADSIGRHGELWSMRPGLPLVGALERLVAMARLESVKVTMKERALHRGTRRRLATAIVTGRERHLPHPEHIVDLALDFALREGILDVDADSRLTVEPTVRDVLCRDVDVLALELLEHGLHVATSQARGPVTAEHVYGLVGGLPVDAWVDAERFRRRFRVAIASQRLGDRRGLLPATVAATAAAALEEDAGADDEAEQVAPPAAPGCVHDSYPGLHESFLSIFHALGMIELGTTGGATDVGSHPGEVDLSTVRALRLTPFGKRLLAGGTATEEVEPSVIVNPDGEVMARVMGIHEPDLFLTELERFADLMGGEGIVRYHINRESVRRAIVCGEPREEIRDWLEHHAHAELPSNVVYSLDEHARSLRFARARPAMIIETGAEPAAEAIAEVVRRCGGECLLLGEGRVSLPAAALTGPDGAALIEALRGAGILLE